jgi:hypothetical protein
MNMRIRKLADEAGFLDDLHGELLCKVQIEKFAELIVRECSQYIVDKFDYCGDEIIIAEKLKEHFGVTEND